MKLNDFKIQISGSSSIAIMSFWLAFVMRSGDRFANERRKNFFTVQNGKHVNILKLKKLIQIFYDKINISGGFSTAADA